jgi:hypothetical protein
VFFFKSKEAEMYDTMLPIPLDSAIQRRIETLAKAAGRSEENQAAYLIEKGLHAVEQRLAAEAPASPKEGILHRICGDKRTRP